MENHSDTTQLLDKTIEGLNASPFTEANTKLLGQWIEVLNQSENTRELAAKLSELKAVLETESPDEATIQAKLNDIADTTEFFGAEIGPEGELSQQLMGLAAALRNTESASA